MSNTGLLHGVVSGDSTFMLVDEDISHDKRVLTALEAYTVGDVQVVNCIDRIRGGGVAMLLDLFKIVFGLLPMMSWGSSLWSVLRSHYGLRACGVLGGFRVSLINYWRAISKTRELSKRVANARLIHAHDLFCGVIGAKLSRLTGARFVYDAHEIEFHRNRKNSWLRSALDSYIEKAIVDRADEIRVVNAPIADLYQKIYRIPSHKIQIVHNNHFPRVVDRSVSGSMNFGSPAFVYVGAGAKGRQLDKLADNARLHDVPVHAFFLAGVPDLASSAAWHIGSIDYEPALVELVKSARCLMWCCVDDVCLSYRLSLPNKFFQAISVGIPVVTSAGTYLADLVTTHGIGYVFDGDNFAEIVEKMRGSDFVLKVEALYRFRNLLDNGTVRI